MTTPGLEPVRRLIRAIDLYHARQTREEALAWDSEIARYAAEALPVLCYLLDEYEYCNSDNMKAHLRELNEDWVEMKTQGLGWKAEVATLRTALKEVMALAKLHTTETDDIAATVLNLGERALAAQSENITDKSVHKKRLAIAAEMDQIEKHLRRLENITAQQWEIVADDAYADAIVEAATIAENAFADCGPEIAKIGQQIGAQIRGMDPRASGKGN